MKTSAMGNLIGEVEKRVLERAKKTADISNYRMRIITDLTGTPREELERFCVRNDIGLMGISLPDRDPHFIFGKHDSHWNTNAHQWITNQLLSHF